LVALPPGRSGVRSGCRADQDPGCGTSRHARSWWGRLPARAAGGSFPQRFHASEFRLCPSSPDGHTRSPSVTQSGETADTLWPLLMRAPFRRAFDRWTRLFAPTKLGIPTGSKVPWVGCLPHSLISACGNLEVGVAAKTFLGQAVGFSTALPSRSRGPAGPRSGRCAPGCGCGPWPPRSRCGDHGTTHAPRLAIWFGYPGCVIFLGRESKLTPLPGGGPNSGDQLHHAEGFTQRRMKHGPIALLDFRRGVGVDRRCRQSVFDKVLSNCPRRPRPAMPADSVVARTEPDTTKLFDVLAGGDAVERAALASCDGDSIFNC